MTSARHSPRELLMRSWLGLFLRTATNAILIDSMLLVRVRPQTTAPAAGLNQPAFVGTVNAICFFAGRHSSASVCDNTTNSSRKLIAAAS